MNGNTMSAAVAGFLWASRHKFLSWHSFASLGPRKVWSLVHLKPICAFPHMTRVALAATSATRSITIGKQQFEEHYLTKEKESNHRRCSKNKSESFSLALAVDCWIACALHCRPKAQVAADKIEAQIEANSCLTATRLTALRFGHYDGSP
jgi:hypothetical protein